MASAEHGSHLPVRSTDPDGTLAKDLASEDILEILRMILAGASLKEVLTSVVRVVESHREGMLCSVWLLDQDRVHMRAIAAPTLPESYVAALDGFVVGPQGGSCGAAVNQRKLVFVSDVLTDPLLEQVRDIIAAHGIRACWSAPIISHQGEILGTFAFYFRSVRSPSPSDIHLIGNATSIAGIAIERKKAEENLRRSEWSLLEAQRLGRSGSWSLDVSSGIVTPSPEMLRSFDVKPGDDCSSTDFWFNRIHPEDRKRVRDLFERCVMENTDYEADYRLLLPDGTIKYQHSIGRPIVNEKGDLVEFVGTAIDLTEQAQARIELEKSEERWRSVFENSAIGVALSDLNGRFLATNHVYQTIVGYTEEELRALCFLDVTHEDYREANWTLITELLEGKRRQFQIEKKYRRKDGNSIWVSNNVSLVPGTERVPRFIMALSEDITQRKRAEEALRSHEQNLRLLVDTIPGLVVTTTPAGEIEHFNRQVLEYFDKTPEELANWRTSDAIHPDDLPLTIAALTRSIQTGEPYEVEHHLRRADGVYRWFHARGLALRDKEGRIVRWYYLLTDVDDRRRAEEALRKSEALLHEAQRLARTGSWSWDVLSGRVVSSPENARINGFQPNEDSAAPEVYFQRIHPDHRERIREAFQTCVVEKTDYQADYPIVLLDGTVKYIHATGHPILNKSGDLIEFFGTTVDVTEQHEARAALQTAFEQIKAEETELRRMTDAIASYVYVLRPDGTALYANQAVLDYTGLTLEDVQREDQRARVFHPEDLERLREERHEGLARGKPFELEQRALGKDGNYRWFLVRYNPLRDDQGHIIRWYATGTDIEDRKRAEESMRDENLALREQIDQAFMFEEIVGSSPALQTVLSSIVKVAPTESTVLITGETGTGKELIARAIHKHSQRWGQAFISVNCASIPSSLIASELFGHEKGAFTGAVQRRQGRFEMAHSGTIFLDEVGELPAETQIALLRVLQERQFERVGGNRIIPTDVRVIAATNRDLTAAIAAGTFRADLFYRLNVFPIEVPPLRKRKEDIPMLVEYFVKRYAEKAGKQIRKIDNSTLERCQSYPWPGNIRELQNIVERSVILCGGDTFWIEKAWLASVQPPRQELAGPLPDTLQNQEKEMIEAALAESKGKVAGPEGAAARLGIPRSTLDSKIKQLGIKKHRFISE